MTDNNKDVLPSRIHADRDSVVHWGGEGLHYHPDVSVEEGEMQTLNFSQNPDKTIGTKGIFDCITLVAHDGEKATVFHVWRSKFYYEELKDTFTEDEIRQGYRRQGRAVLAQVRDNLNQIAQQFDPQKTTITLIGGNSKSDNMVIKNSSRMVKLLDAQLEKLGFSVHHKDLFGEDGHTKPGRSVVVEANGNIHVEGAAERAYTVNIHEIAAKGAIERGVDFSRNRISPPSGADTPSKHNQSLEPIVDDMLSDTHANQAERNGFRFREGVEDNRVKATVRQAFAKAERNGMIMIHPKTTASISASINSISFGARAVHMDQDRLTRIMACEVTPTPNEVYAIALRLGDSNLLGLLESAQRNR